MPGKKRKSKKPKENRDRKKSSTAFTGKKKTGKSANKETSREDSGASKTNGSKGSPRKNHRNKTKDELIRELQKLEREAEKLARQHNKEKQLIAGLREIERRYRLLNENITDNVWMLDIETLRFTYTSLSCKNLLGYNEKEVLKQKLEDVVTPASMDVAVKMLDEELSRDGKKGVDLNRTRTIEMEQIHKDGSIVWTEITTRFLRDAKGHATGILGVSRNITERKKAEERLRLATEVTSDLIYEWDISDDTLQWFGDIDKALGYGIMEIPRTIAGWVTLIHPEDLERLSDAVERHRSETDLIHYEYRIKKKDGSWIYWEDRGMPVLDETGKPRKWIGGCRDITDRKKLEEELFQSRKMESIGRLAGGVAHDLNNMLTPILGYTEILLHEFSREAPRHDDVLQIRNAARRAQELTRQLLAFSRKQVMEMKTLNLGEIVSAFEKILRRTIREHIEFEVSVSPISGNIRTDASQIEQILMNLAVNAQDAMPHGGKLNIAIKNIDIDECFPNEIPELLPGHYVQLTVSDTGSGMDEETLKQIYEPFFTTRQQGTGLGLATVYGIIKQHGGSIQAESIPGRGTTFKIYFPLEDKDAEPLQSKSPVKTPSSYTETILIVEDEEVVRRLTVRILMKQGYHVLAAENGEEAISIVADYHGPIHLLLTDVILPKIDGKKLYQKISSTRSGIRVLYMSGYANDIIKSHGVQEEEIHFIQKPFTIQVLTEKVREALDT